VVALVDNPSLAFTYKSYYDLQPNTLKNHNHNKYTNKETNLSNFNFTTTNKKTNQQKRIMSNGSTFLNIQIKKADKEQDNFFNDFTTGKDFSIKFQKEHNSLKNNKTLFNNPIDQNFFSTTDKTVKTIKKKSKKSIGVR